MRACVQCGLSVSETATFCAVCGARFEMPETPSPIESSASFTDEAVQAEAPVAEEPVVEGPEEDPIERRMTEVAALLEDAAGSETTDPGRAAALYGDAILACLDATEDPVGSGAVHAMLLCSFDALSSLLERGGLPEEALAVVDDAASLGLLNGGDEARTEPRERLKGRREDLRRTLFADSAQL